MFPVTPTYAFGLLTPLLELLRPCAPPQSALAVDATRVIEHITSNADIPSFPFMATPVGYPDLEVRPMIYKICAGVIPGRPIPTFDDAPRCFFVNTAFRSDINMSS